MKRFCIVLAIALTGCGENTDQILAGCQIDALKQYPNAIASDFRKIDTFSQAPINMFVITCMRAKGFDLRIAPDSCETDYNFTAQPGCFASTNWLTKLFSRIK